MVIHIGVGIALLVLDRPGNAKTSKCGTSDSADSCAFLIYLSQKEIIETIQPGNHWRTIKHETVMKVLKMIAISVLITGMFTSCGGSKQAATQNSPIMQEIEVENNACEELQEQKPDVRAVGEGISKRDSRATALAEAQARAQFQRTIESLVKTAQGEEGVIHGGVAGNDEGEISNDKVLAIAEGVVKNMVIIKKSKFMRADGSYHVYVCLEYRGDRKALADDITQKAKQQVSNDERLRNQYDFEKFRQRVEDELAKMRDKK